MWIAAGTERGAEIRGLGAALPVDAAVDGAEGGVDHREMLWVSVSRLFLNLASSWAIVWIFSTAWRTVV